MDEPILGHHPLTKAIYRTHEIDTGKNRFLITYKQDAKPIWSILYDHIDDYFIAKVPNQIALLIFQMKFYSVSSEFSKNNQGTKSDVVSFIFVPTKLTEKSEIYSIQRYRKKDENNRDAVGCNVGYQWI